MRTNSQALENQRFLNHLITSNLMTSRVGPFQTLNKHTLHFPQALMADEPIEIDLTKVQIPISFGKKLSTLLTKICQNYNINYELGDRAFCTPVVCAAASWQIKECELIADIFPHYFFTSAKNLLSVGFYLFNDAELKIDVIKDATELAGIGQTRNRAFTDTFKAHEAPPPQCEGSNNPFVFICLELDGNQAHQLHFYLVDVLPINIGQNKIVQSNLQAFMQIVRERLTLLIKQIQFYRCYNYLDFITELDQTITRHQIDKNYTAFFVETLCACANIHEKIAFSSMTADQEADFFKLTLSVSVHTLTQLIHSLQQQFGAAYCHLHPEHEKTIRFSLSAVEKSMPTLRYILIPSFTNPWNLYENLTAKIERITQHFGISIFLTRCFEMILLRMFECAETLLASSFLCGDLINGTGTMYFFLSVSIATIEKLINKINCIEGQQARYIRMQTKTNSFFQIELHQIAITLEYLSSTQFIEHFQNTLQKVVCDEPKLIKQLRMLSGTDPTPYPHETLTSLFKLRKGGFLENSANTVSHPHPFNCI